MAALWTAFDIDALSTNISAALVIGVCIMLLFVGYRYIKKVGNKV